MIFIICALKCEASPLISTFKLKLSSNNKKCYQSDDVTLYVSGVGSENIQKSMTTLSHLENKSCNIFINIGVCGCNDRSIQRGSAFLINEICCDSSSIPHYPDMIISSTFSESACTTYSSVKTDSNCPTPLADMEAYTFFEEALKHTNSNNIHIIKIVSDYMDSPDITKNEISGFINGNRREIFEHVSSLRIALNTIISDDYSDFYDSYKFTASMRIELNRLNKYRLLRYKKEPGSEIYGGFNTPIDKKESMRIFHEIKKQLI
ncbi:MAG: hypothetical protein KAH14_00725 [Clostridiales bacterium]|nr:hypothetical protein [Clostridiales bacterium]